MYFWVPIKAIMFPLSCPSIQPSCLLVFCSSELEFDYIIYIYFIINYGRFAKWPLFYAILWFLIRKLSRKPRIFEILGSRNFRVRSIWREEVQFFLGTSYIIEGGVKVLRLWLIQLNVCRLPIHGCICLCECRAGIHIDILRTVLGRACLLFMCRLLYAKLVTSAADVRPLASARQFDFPLS
jgi:hypothetical protein